MNSDVRTTYYCRNCGNVYSKVETNRRYMSGTRCTKWGPFDFFDFQTNFETFKKHEECHLGADEKTCPVCKCRLNMVGCSLWEDEHGWNGIQNTEKERIGAEIKGFVEKTKEEAALSENACFENKDTDVLMFLQHLIAVEKNIMLLSQRLMPLMLAQLQVNQAVVRGKSSIERDYKIKTEGEASLLEYKISQLDYKYPKKSLDVSMFDLQMSRPRVPVRKEHNLFNKKRIEREYQLEMEEYEKANAAFEKEFEVRKAAEVESRKQANAENELLREKERIELAAKLEAIRNMKLDLGPEVTALCNLSEKYALEVSEIKAKIRELCEARARFHSSGVIYPKYLDFIAITTMYEYLKIGRCSQLTGPDGCYNLYESEIRANRIIAQLDQVINSLEMIKSTQYYTYTLLADIHKGVDGLTEQMSRIVRSVNAIEDNSAYIAYNTEKIAHYSKINADLTNALGYLVALK